MVFAIVNVLPEPVTPNKTWAVSPAKMPSVNCFIASGWSPVGLYFDVILKSMYAKVEKKVILSYQDTL